jgi:hypothetical protein
VQICLERFCVKMLENLHLVLTAIIICHTVLMKMLHAASPVVKIQCLSMQTFRSTPCNNSTSPPTLIYSNSSFFSKFQPQNHLVLHFPIKNLQSPRKSHAQFPSSFLIPRPIKKLSNFDSTSLPRMFFPLIFQNTFVFNLSVCQKINVIRRCMNEQKKDSIILLVESRNE